MRQQLGSIFATCVDNMYSGLFSTVRVGGPNVTAALLSKIRKALKRPLHFSGYESFHVLSLFAVNFCELFESLNCRFPLHY